MRVRTSTFELGSRSLLSTRGIPHVLLHFFSASLLQGETEMNVSTDPADRNRCLHAGSVLFEERIDGSTACSKMDLQPVVICEAVATVRA